MSILITGSIIVDDAAFKILLNSIAKFFPQDMEFIEGFIERNRCITIKIKYKDQKISLKLVPEVYQNCLSLKIFKVFLPDYGNINISGLMNIFAGILTKYLDKYQVKVDGKYLCLPDIKSNVAGIREDEIFFKGTWVL